MAQLDKVAERLSRHVMEHHEVMGTSFFFLCAAYSPLPQGMMLFGLVLVFGLVGGLMFVFSSIEVAALTSFFDLGFSLWGRVQFFTDQFYD